MKKIIGKESHMASGAQALPCTARPLCYICILVPQVILFRQPQQNPAQVMALVL